MKVLFPNRATFGGGNQAVWSLLHLDAEALRKGLCTRLIVAGGEKMVKQENSDKAKQGRDALAKALYSRLFDHVVQCVNSALRVKWGSKGVCMQVLHVIGATVLGLSPLCNLYRSLIIILTYY